MSCNRDANCLNISNNYGNAKSELKPIFTDLKSYLDDINNELGKLYIPENDYLGEKVEEIVNQVINDFLTDKGTIKTEASNLLSFVSNQETNHRNHYNEWCLSNDNSQEE